MDTTFQMVTMSVDLIFTIYVSGHQCGAVPATVIGVLGQDIDADIYETADTFCEYPSQSQNIIHPCG